MKPTEEQLIAWANEAGFSHYKTKDFAFDRWLGFSETLEIAFALAYEAGAAAEREACAELIPPQYFELRDRIRARGNHD